MAVFLSTFTNKVDRKGRLSVPAPFRSALERESSAGLILYPSFKHPCIDGCGDDRIKQIVEAIDRLDAFSEEAEDLQTILADSRQLSIDGDGRIMMPQDFLDYAGIGETAMFVGLGKSFQIWEPEAYSQHRDAKRQRARERGITLPMAGRSGDRS